MDSMTHFFHFTIAPVQSFIVQSRRTRDLWSSSFLLSWLSGVAMAQVIQTGGRIVFPSVQDGATITDDLLRAIHGNVSAVPFIGTLPNRFKAEVPANFDGAQCADAVQRKWLELATAVKTQFLPLDALERKDLLFVPKKKQQNPNSQNKSLAETLWDQQIKNFWDIQWVKGEAPADGSDARWLDLRKNWRHHIQPDQQEPGDACTLMPGWVELSGYVRSLPRTRQKQDDFWFVVRNQITQSKRPTDANNPGTGSLNLRDDERLCAIAFVKRLWPKLPPSSIKAALGWLPDDKTKSAGNWPSTAYMAALPWIKQTYTNASGQQQERCKNYVAALQNARQHQASDQAREGLFSEVLNQIEGIDNREYFGTLDGQLFYADGLQAAAKEGLLQASLVKALQKQLAGIAQGSQPSPFYAVLRMDGDSVGKLLSTSPHALVVSQALAAFATQVRNIVDRDHDGATLYAGGDDVLALLPLDAAIACAKALQLAYQTAMQSQKLAGTISAAIVFAHYHLPLSYVMAESSRLLDDVAKAQNGRNSLAVAVHKPGGLHLEWASQWDDGMADVMQPVQTLLDLVTQYNPVRGSASAAMPLSSGFLYRIRERWGDLATRNDAGQPVLQFAPSHVQQLWAADLLANRDLGEINDDTRSQANRLAEQLFVISKSNPHLATATTDKPFFSESGGLLVRFLATKGARA